MQLSNQNDKIASKTATKVMLFDRLFYVKEGYQKVPKNIPNYPTLSQVMQVIIYFFPIEKSV